MLRNILFALWEKTNVMRLAIGPPDHKDKGDYLYIIAIVNKSPVLGKNLVENFFLTVLFNDGWKTGHLC